MIPKHWDYRPDSRPENVTAVAVCSQQTHSPRVPTAALPKGTVNAGAVTMVKLVQKILSFKDFVLPLFDFFFHGISQLRGLQSTAFPKNTWPRCHFVGGTSPKTITLPQGHTPFSRSK